MKIRLRTIAVCVAHTALLHLVPAIIRHHKHSTTVCVPTTKQTQTQTINYSVCAHKKTNPTTFIYHIVIKPQLYAVIFGSDLRDNCESAYDYVFHLICVMPIPGKTFERSYILAIKKDLNRRYQIYLQYLWTLLLLWKTCSWF